MLDPIHDPSKDEQQFEPIASSAGGTSSSKRDARTNGLGIDQLWLNGSSNRWNNIPSVIAYCATSLRSLFISCLEEEEEEGLQSLVQMIPLHCRQLRHLGYSVYWEEDVDVWNSILKLCPPLESLKVLGHVDYFFLDIIKDRHSNSLQSVHLEQDTFLDHEHFHPMSILEFCPHLQEFWSDRSFTNKDLLERLPAGSPFPPSNWACVETLTRLHLHLVSLSQARNLRRLEMLSPENKLWNAFRIAWDGAVLREEFEALRRGSLKTLDVQPEGFIVTFS
ncbi:hypothetical protein BGX23_010717 [Mortierella sp. AD031]|nr:hypothetical protein BGX23_010717 [Mortierella sp. AD031]KAG0201067.1 hypothetical protein BGX33_010542 [Mortierella sp. NVP41]